MLDRFTGERGKKLLIDTLLEQKIVMGNKDLAQDIGENVELLSVEPNDPIIAQGADDNDIYFIISGKFQVIVNGRTVAERSAGEVVGEMSAIQPAQRRAATVQATEDSVVAKITEADFDAIGQKHPQLYKFIAQGLSKRLLQRNALINPYRDKVRVFIISSSEALPIARAVENEFEHDPFEVVIWSSGVFRATNYTLEDLEREVDQSDFAIAIAHSDDITQSRDDEWPSPRDNVIFELGMFMGRLGRNRAILLEPRGEKVKLPSDLTGMMTLTYPPIKPTTVSVTCNKLRDHFSELGPNNS